MEIKYYSSFETPANMVTCKYIGNGFAGNIYNKGEVIGEYEAANEICEMISSHGKTWADGWSAVSVNHKYYYICEVN